MDDDIVREVGTEAEKQWPLYVFLLTNIFGPVSWSDQTGPLSLGY